MPFRSQITRKKQYNHICTFLVLSGEFCYRYSIRNGPHRLPFPQKYIPFLQHSSIPSSHVTIIFYLFKNFIILTFRYPLSSVLLHFTPYTSILLSSFVSNPFNPFSCSPLDKITFQIYISPNLFENYALRRNFSNYKDSTNINICVRSFAKR